MSQLPNLNHSHRYAELDWLRVLLIFAVFVHHVLMPFNGDGWHIMNNESSKLLDDVMVFFEQLRLPTLFLIAGAGSTLLLHKTNGRAFLKTKFHRLFIPLVVGILIVVPPQAYFENPLQYQSMLDAYAEQLLKWRTNHLWFIEFLLVFMLLSVPFYKWLGTARGLRLATLLSRFTSRNWGLFSLVVIMALIRVTSKSYFESDDNSVSNLSKSAFYLCFFVAGMIFMFKKNIWQNITTFRRANLIFFIISSIVFYIYYLLDFSAYASIETRWQIWWVVCTFVSWSGMLAMLGYAAAYLTTTPTWLKRTNEFIYPFYILHQTVIVIWAFFIVQTDWGIALKALVLLTVSFISCFAICNVLISKVNWARYLTGLKPQQGSVL